MKKAEIIILAGQSNAVGVGHTRFLPLHFTPERIEKWRKGYENVRINYYSHDKKSGGFIPTQFNCCEIRKDTIGPEVGIAEYIDDNYPGKEAFIVKCAYGGTSLFWDWISPSGEPYYDKDAYADQKDNIIDNYNVGDPIRPGWCYNELVKLLKESIAALEAEGYTVSVKGFCWMQGEADAGFDDHTENYVRRYDALLNDFRKEFSPYVKDCVYVDAGISELWKNCRKLNGYKKEYADSHTDCAFVDTVGAGLTTKNEPIEEPDIAHYDSDSVIKLGHMFAEPIKL
ncbi:MAG: hypothetical protein II135_05890 [Clostridia bacterium]|nr:hypothetical protein [Clostridia bacterium]